MVQTVNSELALRFIALVNAADECHEEYETTHGDAGDAHLHMVSDGNKNELIAKIKAHAIATGSTDSEAALIASKFDRFAVEAKSCHRFTSFDAASIGGLLVGGPWMIEEIENQHEVSRYATELDCEESEVRQLVMSPLADKELCIRFHGENFATFETYLATDCGWYAILPASWFIETIAEIRQEAAEAAEAELRVDGDDGKSFTAISISVDGVWAGSGKLRDGIIEDCGAVFAGDQEECENVYELIEEGIEAGTDSIKVELSDRDAVIISWTITAPS